MKKLLALVLALVMTLGLATVGANAAYADQDDINYEEAVDVMSAIGVLAGDETGFRPTDTLKRSEGAKIIAYLIAGQATADAMTATGTKYTDLPANHWAAGYMEYLSAIGVMGGLGDGRIDPDGSLSATAFAKMLLVALGYDAKIEGMGGPDWAINTQRLANKNNLFKGNSSVVGSAAITREEAALYALNTLKAPVVEYENKGSTLAVNGATIEFGASNATYMTTTDSGTRYKNIANKLVNGTSGEQIVEFAEQYYDGLKLASAGTDAFGRPANVWTLKGKEVGTYTKAADLEYTEGVKTGTIYADLGLTSSLGISQITVKEDGQTPIDNPAGLGTAAHRVWNDYVIAKNGTNKYGGNGALTQVYYDADTNTAEIFVTNTYFAKVTAAYAASSSRDAYVTLGTTINNENTGIGATYDTDAFKVDDYVLYTYSFQTGDVGIQSMELATATQGTLSAFSSGSDVTVDGATIKSNCAFYSKATIGDSLQNAIGTTVTVFKDKYDFAVAVDATAASDAYAVVIGFNNNASSGTLVNRQAALLFADGTSKTVNVSNATDLTWAAIGDAGVDNEITLGDIVTYRLNSDGSYKLAIASEAIAYDSTGSRTLTDKADSRLNVTGGNAVGIRRGAANTGGTSTQADGKTAFVLYDLDTDTGAYKFVGAYKGIANVPKVASNTGTYAAAYEKNHAGRAVADFVAINVHGATVTKKGANELIFVIGSSNDSKYDATLGTYYQYKGIADGKIIDDLYSSQKINYSMIATTAEKDEKGVYTFDKDYATASGSFYLNPPTNSLQVTTTSGNAAGNAYYGVGTDAMVNGTITLDGNPLSVASGVKVYTVNSAADKIVESSIGAIQKDTNDKVWYTTDDSGYVNYIVVQTVDPADTTYTVTLKMVNIVDDPNGVAAGDLADDSVGVQITPVTNSFVKYTANAASATVTTGNEMTFSLAKSAKYTIQAVKYGTGAYANATALAANANGSYTVPAVTAATTIWVDYTEPLTLKIGNTATTQGELANATIKVNGAEVEATNALNGTGLTYTYGDSVRIVIDADTGNNYVVRQLKINGINTMSDSETLTQWVGTVNMDADCNIAALVNIPEVDEYVTITVKAESDGVTPNNVSVVYNGQSYVATAEGTNSFNVPKGSTFDFTLNFDEVAYEFGTNAVKYGAAGSEAGITAVNGVYTIPVSGTAANANILIDLDAVTPDVIYTVGSFEITQTEYQNQVEISNVNLLANGETPADLTGDTDATLELYRDGEKVGTQTVTTSATTGAITGPVTFDNVANDKVSQWTIVVKGGTNDADLETAQSAAIGLTVRSIVTINFTTSESTKIDAASTGIKKADSEPGDAFEEIGVGSTGSAIAYKGDEVVLKITTTDDKTVTVKVGGQTIMDGVTLNTATGTCDGFTASGTLNVIVTEA